MTILIFILVLVALIVVHEFGHFVAAKWAGMRVDEFGLGYPPRAKRVAKVGETEYTLNWLPFGGFVKIYGEDGVTSIEEKVDDHRSFTSKPRFKQAIVLVAGVAMNLLFAYVLITGALVVGTPRALADDEVAVARDIQLVVGQVLPGSPAAEAGLARGDLIVAAEDGHYIFEGKDAKAFTSFIAQGGGNATLTLTVRRGDGTESIISARPRAGVIESDPARAALGVELATIGVVPVPFSEAVTQGAELTWGATLLTAEGLWHFFANIFTLQADLSQVAGPVGIAGVVGSASAQG
jgi:regulator of sigma E protease